MKNRYKDPDEIIDESTVEASEEPTKKEKSRPKMKTQADVNIKKIGSSFRSIFGGSFFSRKEFLNSFPYIIMLFLFAILYIFNNYLAEKNMIKLEKSKRDLIEFRQEYISSKSDMMDSLKESSIQLKLLEIGVVENNTPPIKLMLQKDSTKNDR